MVLAMTNVRDLLHRPLLAYRVLVPLLVAFWFVSGVGGGNGADADDSDLYWIGQLGWALFLVTALTTILFTLAVLARRVLRRRATS